PERTQQDLLVGYGRRDDTRMRRVAELVRGWSHPRLAALAEYLVAHWQSRPISPFLPRLVDLLGAESSEIRIQAARAAAAVLAADPERLHATLAPLLADSQHAVRMAAGRLLAGNAASRDRWDEVDGVLAHPDG